MKHKIKRIIKLPNYGSESTNWYHVYITEPGFGVDPKGAFIEETVSESGRVYSVKPLGIAVASNIIYGTPSLHTQHNETREFYDWIKALDQTEICNLVHGRELLMG